MSTLRVATIETENDTTDLTLKTGNTSGPNILLSAGNNDVQINGNFVLTDLSLSGNLTINSVVANGSLGSAGQVLHSNGSSTYWSADDQGVTSVGSGNGLTGGTITTTGTLSVRANTGIIANATGLYVNSAYIGTLSANNTTFISGNNVLSVMESLRANRNIQGGGTITVDGSGYILWSQRFIVISNGRGAHFSTAGYFDITCPTSGTITGVGGASNKTATAAGIPLGAWEALYYIMPIGSAQTSSTAYFRVATYTSDVEIPSDWLLICVRNGDTGNFYFNNGIILKTGQSFVGGSHTSTTIGSNTFTVGTSTYFVANGNVGIGTTSPSAKLDVVGNAEINGSVSTTGALTVDSASDAIINLDKGSGSGAINFKENGQTGWQLLNTSSGHFAYYRYVAGSYTDTPFAIYNNTGYVNVANRLGIGTSSPSEKLDVVGNAEINGNIIVTGGISANGSLGTSGQVLTSNSSGAYWANAEAGISTGKAIAMAIVFG